MITAEISNPKPGRENDLERQTQECLLKLGWVLQASDIVRVMRNYFPYAYPVHDLERADRVRRLCDFLRSKQVWSIGRFGAWNYSSIDDAIAEAPLTVPAALAPISMCCPER